VQGTITTTVVSFSLFFPENTFDRIIWALLGM